MELPTAGMTMPELRVRFIALKVKLVETHQRIPREEISYLHKNSAAGFQSCGRIFTHNYSQGRTMIGGGGCSGSVGSDSGALQLRPEYAVILTWLDVIDPP